MGISNKIAREASSSSVVRASVSLVFQMRAAFFAVNGFTGNCATSAASRWPAAKLYTEAEVQPHVDGFSAMKWGKAKFIWGDNLVTDNTVLLRKTVTRASSR